MTNYKSFKEYFNAKFKKKQGAGVYKQAKKADDKATATPAPKAEKEVKQEVKKEVRKND